MYKISSWTWSEFNILMIFGIKEKSIILTHTILLAIATNIHGYLWLVLCSRDTYTRIQHTHSLVQQIHFKLFRKLLLEKIKLTTRILYHVLLHQLFWHNKTSFINQFYTWKAKLVFKVLAFNNSITEKYWLKSITKCTGLSPVSRVPVPCLDHTQPLTRTSSDADLREGQRLAVLPWSHPGHHHRHEFPGRSVGSGLCRAPAVLHLLLQRPVVPQHHHAGELQLRAVRRHQAQGEDQPAALLFRGLMADDQERRCVRSWTGAGLIQNCEWTSRRYYRADLWPGLLKDHWEHRGFLWTAQWEWIVINTYQPNDFPLFKKENFKEMYIAIDL